MKKVLLFLIVIFSLVFGSENTSHHASDKNQPDPESPPITVTYIFM